VIGFEKYDWSNHWTNYRISVQISPGKVANLAVMGEQKLTARLFTLRMFRGLMIQIIET